MSYPCDIHVISLFQKRYISHVKKNEQIPLFSPLRPSGPAAGTLPLLTSKVLLLILRPLGIISCNSGLGSDRYQVWGKAEAHNANDCRNVPMSGLTA